MGKEQELLDAARNGNINLVYKIVAQNKKRVTGPLSSFRRGTNINVQDMNGYTPLHHASLNGHSEIVHLLCIYNAAVDVRDIRGSTPLYVAAWAGHNDIVKNLLFHPKMSADPNSQTIDNETPLHCAAQNGKHVALAILLSHGGDPSIRNNSFQTPLDLAAKYGRLQCVQVLLRTHPELIEPLRIPNTAEMNESDLGHSPSYDHTSPYNNTFTHTCLHMASRNGHKEVVEILLAAGVDVNIATNEGTALHEAALRGKKAVVVTLLEAGINPYATDGKGRTALDLIKDFPPHVTYEIVSAITDFCSRTVKVIQNLLPIIDENANHEDFISKNEDNITSDSNKSDKGPYLKNQTLNVIKEIKSKPKTSSVVQEKPLSNYLIMRPIADINEQRAPTVPAPLKKVAALSKSCERIFSGETIPNKSKSLQNYNYEQRSGNGNGNNKYMDGYVKMSKISIEAPELPYRKPPTLLESNKIRKKKPIPVPRSTFQVDDETLTSTTDGDGERSCSTTPTNVNANGIIRYQPRRHSQTPDFPPPTVSQAESTIFEFMQPLNVNGTGTNDQHFENVAFIWENVSSQDDSHSSRTSDYFVEEFVGTEPFAGLFKGSTLTLNGNSENERSDALALERRCGLRSPSLVRAVKPIPPKCTLLQKDGINVSTDEISVSKVWQEIDTIFESIGSEATTATAINGLEEKETNDDEIKIRQPVDLALAGSESSTTNWCHSASTLIYSHVLYKVYYLGSTVIRELRGTFSTRKSIQKLKLDALREGAQEETLLENCNNSTKILKANNQQTRLKVGISLSHVGVRFIDAENDATMCVHEIENINCVCQDNEDLRYFAYITKENDIHYCHVFMVDETNLAAEIILTLGQAFEVAYQLAMRQQDEMCASMTSAVVENDVIPIATTTT